MRDTRERVRQVQLLARKLRLKRESRHITGLSFLSGLLVLFLGGTLYGLTGGLLGVLEGDTEASLFGTMLLYENAGGYVLAAVLSFAAAVVITVLCIRHRERSKSKYLKMEGGKK